MPNISLPRDNNGITVIGGTSSTDGVSPVTIYVDPVTHRLKVDASSGSAGITVGSTTITGGTNTYIEYNNAGVLGEYSLTGTGTVVVMATSPTLVTPILGVASATSINKMAITAPATSSTLAIADGKTFTVSNTFTFTGTDGSSVAFGTGGTVLYANQTITLSGDVTGSGTTAITTTVAKIAGTTVSGTTGTTNVVFSGTPTIVTPSFTTGFTIGGVATSRKIPIGNGTNFVQSTETYAMPGTSGNVMTSDGTNWTSAPAAGGGAMTLLHTGVSNSTTTTATNLDTIAISGLTNKDTLLVYWTISVGGAGGNNTGLSLYSNTDSIPLMALNDNMGLNSGSSSGGMTMLRQESQASTNVFGSNVDTLTAPTTGGNTFTTARPFNQSNTTTTAWTGSWTLALRSAGLSGAGTIYYSWSVFKIAG